MNPLSRFRSWLHRRYSEPRPLDGPYLDATGLGPARTLSSGLSDLGAVRRGLDALRAEGRRQRDDRDIAIPCVCDTLGYARCPICNWNAPPLDIRTEESR